MNSLLHPALSNADLLGLFAHFLVLSLLAIGGAITTAPESFATFSSRPVPTSGVRGFRSGTAWRCMFEPIRARFASSCSRKGISAVATETTCLGLTSMYSIWPARASGKVSR